MIYRRYASLIFIVGSKPDIGEAENTENKFEILEFIHALLECMDKWAGSICELDIMYQLEEVYFLVDEMVQNGYLIETNKQNELRPISFNGKRKSTRRSMCPLVRQNKAGTSLKK